MMLPNLAGGHHYFGKKYWSSRLALSPYLFYKRYLMN